MKITNSSLSRIIIGLMDLSKLDISDFEINLGITRLVSKLTNLEKEYNKTKTAHMNEHIAVNERGSYIVDGGKMYVYKSQKDKEEYYNKITELNETEVENNFKIKATDLKKINNLKASTMINIMELIDDDM
jgi:hypothetical protein